MPTGPLLIVDDEPRQLEALSRILSPQYPLVTACNGAGAIAAARSCRPSLVLMDVRMPGMGGHAACRQIKADPELAGIPVIFIDGPAGAGDEAAGFDAGGVDHIVKPFKPAIVLARVRTHLSLVKANRLDQSYRDAILMLGEAGRYNDNDTGLHIWRMGAYARALARAAGWNEDDSALIELAAAMHDTGKIGIPSAILRKPGSLDGAERAVMQTHCRLGYDILSKSDAPLFKMAAVIALRHHERWDGSGYPDGLAGTDIPESARIVAVADVFDALSIARPYKEAWPIARVMRAIREGAGSQFEPRLVEAFCDILPEIVTLQDACLEQEKGPRRPEGPARLVAVPQAPQLPLAWAAHPEPALAAV